jgi:hypothetical protein
VNDPIVSTAAFQWFLSGLTGIVAGAWFCYDGIRLVQLRRGDRGVATVRDKQFGYAMGMVIGALGVIGVLRFHGVL